MSTLIEKLERYANNLEDIVAQRTAELVMEKKKTEELLYRMIPRYESPFIIILSTSFKRQPFQLGQIRYILMILVWA